MNFKIVKLLEKFVIFGSFVIFASFSEPKYCKLSDKIFNPYNRELKKSKGLNLVGSGGAMMKDIQKINAVYISFESLNINDARKLYVEVIEGYLNRYNQNEKIRPYLHNFPFTVDNLSVRISFEDENRHFRSGGYVALTFVGKHQHLVYCGYDPVTDDFIDLHEEPYETAREIVMIESATTGVAN